MGNLTSIKHSVTRGINMSKLKIKAYSPEILISVGSLATVGACVLAGVRTKKFESYLTQYKEDRESIETSLALSEERGDGLYTEDNAKTDVLTITTDLVTGFFKSYWPSITLVAASIACNVYANKIMSKRVVSLTAQVASITAGFAAYRKNVIERFGENVDKELRFGSEKVEYIDDVQNEDGTVTQKAQEYVKTNETSENLLTKFIPENYVFGGAGAAYADLYAQGIQHFACLEMDTKGCLFLNDLLDEINVLHNCTDEEIVAGQTLGWPRIPDRAWDAQFEVKTKKAVKDGVKGVLIELPEPINLLSYLRRKGK